MSLRIVKTLLGFILLLGAKNSVQAAPLHLPATALEEFRQAVYSRYQQEMAAGGYYDCIKERHYLPKLRILDCLGEQCLMDMETEPNWWRSLHLVTIRENRLVDMKHAGVGVAVLHRACFVQLPAPIATMAIYALSTTHMGTVYEDLVDAAPDSSRGFAHYAFRSHWYEKSGATNYFLLARHTLRQLPQPFEF